MKVWYLYHSGVAVRTGGYLLIFDYWKNHTLPGGIPALIQKENCPVLVFCSHAHDDHFNPEILQWRRNFSKVEYILSDDIASQTGCTMLSSGAVLSRPDYTVRTFASTDAGVAFLVEIDGVSIYHAGDLHWWHWSSEPDQENRASCKVTVKAEAVELTIAKTDVSIKIGESFNVGAKGGNITYRSGDPDIAVIGADGVVTGKNYGKTNVYASNGSMELGCIVRVK